MGAGRFPSQPVVLPSRQHPRGPCLLASATGHQLLVVTGDLSTVGMVCPFFLLEMILPSFLCVCCIVTFFDPASVFLPRPEAEGESLLFRQRQSVLRGRLPGEFVAEAPLPAVPSRTRCGDAEGPQPGPEGGSPLCCPRRGSRPSFRRCPRSEASNRPQGFGL